MTFNLRLASDKQLAVLHEQPDEVAAFLFGADDEPTIAHDPAHDLHFGEEWSRLKELPAVRPLSEGGRAMTGAEARSFTAAEVAKLATALGPLKQPGEELQQLKVFLGAAAAKRLGLIAYFS